MSSSGHRRTHNEESSSDELETAGLRRSGRAPVPSEKRRARSESPPPAPCRAKKTKTAALPSSPESANALPTNPTNAASSSENLRPSPTPTETSIVSLTPAEVPQPTTLVKQGRLSTTAHDVNAFFTRGKGQKTVCIRCKCVLFSLTV